MEKKTKVIALLPMKGNSERVPNKNLKLFNGKPLYQWTLSQLQNSRYIDEIIINTDSPKIENSIADLNLENVIIHHRPDVLKGDSVSMNKIILHDLENSNADIYIQTHTTNPLLKSDSIDSLIEEMFSLVNDNKPYYDSIFSVNKLQSRFYNSSNQAINHNPDDLIPTQDLDPVYEENSCIYIFTKESFYNSNNKRIGANPKMMSINPLESLDIDTIEDFIIAQAIHKLKLNHEI